MPIQPDIAPKRKAASPSLLDPASMLQNAQAEQDKVQQQIANEAQAYSIGRQHAMEQAQQQYAQGQQTQLPNPISPMAALPYMANAFAAGFSGNDQLRQSAEHTVQTNLETLKQRRAENLSRLHEQYLQAAQQAQQAGDTEREIKWRTMADKASERVQVAQRGLERKQEQDFQAGQAALERGFRERENAIQRGVTIWQAQMDNPILRERVRALGGAYEQRSKSIGDQLAMLSVRRDPQSGAIRDKLINDLNQLTASFNSQLGALQAAVPAAPTGGGVVPGSAVPPGGAPSTAPPTPAFQNPFDKGSPASGTLPPMPPPGMPPTVTTGPQGVATTPMEASQQTPQNSSPFAGPAPPPAVPGPSSMQDTVSMPGGFSAPRVYVGLAEALNIPSDKLDAFLKAKSLTMPDKTNEQVLKAAGYDPAYIWSAQKGREALASQEYDKARTSDYWMGQEVKFAGARERSRAGRMNDIRQELKVLRAGTIDDMRIALLKKELEQLATKSTTTDQSAPAR